MKVSDDTLLDIIVLASRGNGVLVLVDHASLIELYTQRLKALIIDGLMKHGNATAYQAQNYILPGRNAWKVDLRSKGWIFFYPEYDVKPNDDVGNPKYVYVTNDKGRYECIGYATWRSRLPAVTNPTPTEEAPKDPKDAWSRLIEDD